MTRLGTDLASPPTLTDLQRALPAVLAAVARGKITLGEARAHRPRHARPAAAPRTI
jgi:hypothetical protein